MLVPDCKTSNLILAISEKSCVKAGKNRQTAINSVIRAQVSFYFCFPDRNNRKTTGKMLT